MKKHNKKNYKTPQIQYHIVSVENGFAGTNVKGDTDGSENSNDWSTSDGDWN